MELSIKFFFIKFKGNLDHYFRDGIKGDLNKFRTVCVERNAPCEQFSVNSVNGSGLRL